MNGSRQPILLIADALERPIASARQTISAAGADAQTAKMLKLPIGSPILQTRRHYFDMNGEVMSIALGFLHPKRVEIIATLQMSSSKGRYAKRLSR
jgi:DNA-binding GntR family transcriptional regulator